MTIRNDSINKAWDREPAPEVAAMPLFRSGIDGLPYRWDGRGFVDPSGLRVITPRDLRDIEKTLLANPTAARCQDPRLPQPHGDPLDSHAAVSAPLVGTPDAAVIDRVVSDAMLTGQGWCKTKADGTHERVTPEEARRVVGDGWSGYHHLNIPFGDSMDKNEFPPIPDSAQKAFSDMHIGDADSNKRWLEQREKYMKLMGYTDPKTPEQDTPPMPQSAQISAVADRISDAIISLINSKPQSPRKDEIAEVVTAGLAGLKMLIDAMELQQNPLFYAERIPDAQMKMTTGAARSVPTGLRRVPPDYWDDHAAMAHVIAEPFVDGFRDKDGHVIAFKPFGHYDGPKTATYQGVPDGPHYVYQTFAWKSRDPAKIVARLDELAKRMTAHMCHTIVWRCRPEMMLVNGVYKFYCRLHIFPYVTLDGATLEGMETPEA